MYYIIFTISFLVNIILSICFCKKTTLLDNDNKIIRQQERIYFREKILIVNIINKIIIRNIRKKINLKNNLNKTLQNKQEYSENYINYEEYSIDFIGLFNILKKSIALKNLNLSDFYDNIDIDFIDDSDIEINTDVFLEYLSTLFQNYKFLDNSLIEREIYDIICRYHANKIINECSICFLKTRTFTSYCQNIHNDHICENCLLKCDRCPICRSKILGVNG